MKQLQELNDIKKNTFCWHRWRWYESASKNYG